MASPHLTFHLNGDQITAVDARDQPLATLQIQRMGRRTFQISRGGAPVATSDTSTLSGSTRLTVHGQAVLMKHTWIGMQSGKELDTVGAGKLSWRPGGSTWRSVEELTDARGTVLARCRMGSFGKKDKSGLEVLVPVGDEVLVDTILASWVTMLDD